MGSDNKFEVGNNYRASSLYGRDIRYRVIERNEKQVTMKEMWIDEDTGDEASDIQKYDIELECGIEKIRIWEYHGHEAYIYANEGF